MQFEVIIEINCTKINMLNVSYGPLNPRSTGSTRSERSKKEKSVKRKSKR